MRAPCQFGAAGMTDAGVWLENLADILAGRE